MVANLRLWSIYSETSEIYQLWSCIEFIESVLGPDKIGHYIAHSYKKDGQWEHLVITKPKS